MSKMKKTLNNELLAEGKERLVYCANRKELIIMDTKKTENNEVEIIIELLFKQLEILAEKSKEINEPEDLVAYSLAMCKVAKCIKTWYF